MLIAQQQKALLSKIPSIKSIFQHGIYGKLYIVYESILWFCDDWWICASLALSWGVIRLLAIFNMVSLFLACCKKAIFLKKEKKVNKQTNFCSPRIAHLQSHNTSQCDAFWACTSAIFLICRTTSYLVTSEWLLTVLSFGLTLISKS